MTPSRQRPLATNALERLIENRILLSESLYDLDGELSLRTRDGRLETCFPEVDR
jgi:hypothetical protein